MLGVYHRDWALPQKCGEGRTCGRLLSQAKESSGRRDDFGPRITWPWVGRFPNPFLVSPAGLGCASRGRALPGLGYGAASSSAAFLDSKRQP